MLGLFRKAKKPEFDDKPLKPIYKENKENKTFIISCPYCHQDLREVYYLRVNEVVIGRCRYCGKELG